MGTRCAVVSCGRVQAQVSSSTSRCHQRVRPDSHSRPPRSLRSHEQRRLVGKIKSCLNRIEEMRRLREEAAIDAEALVDGAFNEVWESVAIADAPQVRLAELGSITTGNTPSRKVPEYFDSTGTPWITPGDIMGRRKSRVPVNSYHREASRKHEPAFFPLIRLQPCAASDATIGRVGPRARANWHQSANQLPLLSASA